MTDNIKKCTDIARSIRTVNTFFHKEFSGLNSQITIDIICLVVAHQIEPHLTVKNLFESLPQSDMGIRYRFNRLIKDGYIELHNGSSDTRIKFVKPSQKLLDKFSKIVHIFDTKLNNINHEVRNSQYCLCKIQCIGGIRYHQTQIEGTGTVGVDLAQIIM